MHTPERPPGEPIPGPDSPLTVSVARDLLLHPGGHARSLIALAAATVVADLDRLRAAAGELLDAMTAEGHYSDPAGCDERTERATRRVAAALK